jgi:hypothetical protein
MLSVMEKNKHLHKAEKDIFSLEKLIFRWGQPDRDD